MSKTQNVFWGFFIVGTFTLGIGTAQAGDSSVPTMFATIQAAIDDVGTVAGDTITLEAGTHNEDNIHVTKSVTIAGTGIGSSILEATSSGAGIGFFPEADGITFRDLTIRDFSQAVRFFVSGGGTIDGTTFDAVRMEDCTSRGIEVHNTTTVTNLVVKNSEFEDVNHGLRVSSSGHIDGATFTDSDFIGGRIGIYEANDGGTSTMKNIEITGCLFKNIQDGQATGIFLEEIQNAYIDGNTFMNTSRDFQIFKWYQASEKVSNVTFSNNISTGSDRGCFTLFNAHHTSGQTDFDNIIAVNNSCDMTNGDRAVFAGAHSSTQSTIPSEGGTGWDSVHISCNNFTGNFTWGVQYFDPTPGGIDGDTLGGDTLDVQNNWWDETVPADVEALMEEPSITDSDPFLVSAADSSCLCLTCPTDSDGKSTICHKGKTISVSPRALPAHCVNHDDTCGACE